MSKQQERSWKAMKEMAGVEERCVDCGDVRHVTNMCHTLIGEPVCPPCFSKDQPSPVHALEEDRKHSHYFRSVKDLEWIDFYRIVELYNITDPVVQHILKKTLAPGDRGLKDFRHDMQDIYDSAARRLQMLDEDAK